MKGTKMLQEIRAQAFVYSDTETSSCYPKFVIFLLANFYMKF